MTNETKVVPLKATDEMHDAARDWSYKQYGKPIGFEASHGCWEAMVAAAPPIDNLALVDQLVEIVQAAETDYKNAWRNITDTLDAVAPTWRERCNTTLDSACSTIEDLAQEGEDAARYRAWRTAGVGNNEMWGAEFLRCLPEEVHASLRYPTDAEWDQAVDDATTSMANLAALREQEAKDD